MCSKRFVFVCVYFLLFFELVTAKLSASLGSDVTDHVEEERKVVVLRIPGGMLHENAWLEGPIDGDLRMFRGVENPLDQGNDIDEPSLSDVCVDCMRALSQFLRPFSTFWDRLLFSEAEKLILI